MPDYSFYAYSNLDLGGNGGDQNSFADFNPGSQFSAGGTVETMTITDDDTVLDDEGSNGGQTVDGSQQTLTSDFGTSSAGQVVQSVYQWEFENTTTGETGTLFLIRIYEGTDPSNPGAQDGQYFYASDIALNPGDSFVYSNGNYIGQANYSELLGPAAPCFVRGTMIETDRGAVAVEDLAEGDLVRTRDSGLQPVRWVGSRRIAAKGDFAPVVIGKDVLGNAEELLLSQNHRVLLTGWKAQALFDQAEVLVTAKSLVNDDAVYVRPGGTVDYFHVLFDAHQIIFANGVETESFHPGMDGVGMASDAVRAEVLALFPELADDASLYGPVVRATLGGHEEALLASNVAG